MSRIVGLKKQCLLQIVCRPEIQEFKAATLAAGKPLVFNGGPASLLCTFPNPNQTYVYSSALLPFRPNSYAEKSFAHPLPPPETSATSS